jgi:hypothetical protein
VHKKESIRTLKIAFKKCGIMHTKLRLSIDNDILVAIKNHRAWK